VTKKVPKPVLYHNLAILCIQKGVSVAEMARNCGFGVSTTTSWAKGVCTPTNKSMSKMAKYFGVTLSEFQAALHNIESDPPNAERHETPTSLKLIIDTQKETIAAQEKTIQAQADLIAALKEKCKHQPIQGV